MNFDLKNIFDKLRNVQSEFEKIKSELAQKTITSESGGGMVTVEMNGIHKLKKIKISPELLNNNDIQMIEDLIVAAVNKAYEKVDDMNKDELSKLQNFIPNIPGMNFNL